MDQKLKAVLLLFLLPFFAFTQNTINGTVLESNGLPALGATITLKSSSNRTSTDFDGKYTLKNIPNNAIIVFSFIGYATQEILYTDQSVINVTLQENPSELESIVPIAYGSLKKANVTTAQSTVKMEDFNKGAITSPGQLISGKVAGVQVTAASGRPGDQPIIRIRPGATLGGNQEALYVVDGVPLDQRNASLKSINPADIESFTILKDASATAIYGIRASNGVVLITTKQAELDSKLKLSYDVQFAINQTQNYTNVLNADEFRQLVVDQGRDLSILGTATTDWQNEIYQNGTKAIHNFIIEKGYENTSIRTSLGYINEHGTLLRSGYERATLGINVKQNFLKGDLQLTFTSQLAQEEIRNGDSDAIGAAIIFDPTQPIFNETGDFNGYFEYTNTNGIEPNAPRNPLGLLNSLHSQLDNKQARLNLNVAYNIKQVQGLKFTGNTGIDYNKFNSYTFRDVNSGEGSFGNNRSFGEGLRRNQLIDGRFNYKRSIESLDTDIDLTLGGSYQNFLRQTTGKNTVNGSLQENLSTIDPSTLTTVFTRASFNIKDLVVLSGSVSQNSSSRFSKNNRKALFYGASTAVKFTNTNFVQNSGFLSRLKLRSGFGQTGQQDIPVSPTFFSAFTTEESQAADQFGNQFVTTIRPEGAVDLKWETTNQWNIGTDLGFFDDRITGSVDAFYKKTKDLLLLTPLPVNGLGNEGFQNAGATLSKGIESSLTLKIIQSENMNWTLSANATFQEIEITDLIGVDNSPIQVTGISGGTGNNIQEWTIGSDPTAFHVFRQVYDQDGNPLDGVYMDTNEDNIINDADRVRYKKANHDVYFGLTSNFNYKNFDLSFTFRGASGGYNYNNVASSTANYGSVFPINTQNPLYINAPIDILDTNFSQQRLFSDYYIQKADFIKLDNISLSYNFPSDKVDVKASITGTNLLTITDYDGVDPEIFGGIDNNLFPRSRGLIFGLGFNF